MGDGRKSLGDLQNSAEFVRRHIGPGPEDVAAMLEVVGHDSLDALLRAAVPASIVEADPVDLPPPVGEREALERIRRIAGRNRVLRSMIGCGYHDTVVPPVILRNVLENPGWYTAYTPYQPEISQGRLEALLVFQTMIMDLTGLALANASMLDEATAAAEAMTLCHRSTRGRGDSFVVAADCHPQTIAVVRTRAGPLGLKVVVADDPAAAAGGEGVFGVLVQYPATDGSLRDPQPAIEAAHAAGALAVVAADPLALVLLKSPGEMGADVAVGSTQRFGVPPGFGGPHAAYLATREEWKRSVPGRLVGVSVDSEGRPGYRLALQTREQHIRRDKATSNICTAQVLLANMAGLYAIWHGPEGLARIAGRVHRLAAILAAGLRGFGVAVETESFFDTVTINLGDGADRALAKAREAGYNLRPMGDGRISIAVDETTSRQDIQAVWRALADATRGPSIEQLDADVAEAVPAALRREGPALRHDIFSTVGCETDMLRYLRRLQEKDLALDRCMIPLGSCTMKLNATSEMIPVTWPEFASLHPHVPADQANGYRELIGGLEDMLCRITGFDAVSLQPNAGSQGEYAGLLAIRAWHASRDEGDRDVCLIPASAHGTNPASAVLAGMRVVVVACDGDGNVDVADLQAKAAEHAAGLAALMITYPSTHGVYEAAITEICDIVHQHGGQVYMDGANMNALVGWCLPGRFGADVAHLNLHKTFCIPHGGGGPGVGPIGVRAHLEPFLPGHPLGREFAHGGAPVAAAPWGSASILPITWMYLTMMGGAGLQLATEVAILNANYIARRLAPHFPVLYSGPGGLVAHECIIDLRPLRESAGIEVDDVAKRLMDYGFHAPTMSFPVPGTLMIEPTESEPKAEIDRFCDAMIAIRGEIREIEEGRMDADDNPLKNAPHTAMALAAEDWPHPYSRRQAVFPAPGLMQDKYWPPVSRVDNVAGDRNLVCDCPPVEAYLDAAEAAE